MPYAMEIFFNKTRASRKCAQVSFSYSDLSLSQNILKIVSLLQVGSRLGKFQISMLCDNFRLLNFFS